MTDDKKRQQFQDRKSDIMRQAQRLATRGQREKGAILLVRHGIFPTLSTALIAMENVQANASLRRTIPPRIKTVLDRPVPNGYRWVDHQGPAGAVWDRKDGFRVIETIDIHAGEQWHHCSCSYARKMPTYDDLAEIKRFFIGPNRTALQVFPRASKHVSQHEYVLHLWTNLEREDVVPDFAPEGTI